MINHDVPLLLADLAFALQQYFRRMIEHLVQTILSTKMPSGYSTVHLLRFSASTPSTESSATTQHLLYHYRKE